MIIARSKWMPCFSWNWSVFTAILIAIVVQNAGQGVFQQGEEVLLLPAANRGQTEPVSIGWPIAAVSTEAYTLNIVWTDRFGSLLTPTIGILYLFLDCIISGIVCIGSTTCFCAIIDRCNWKFNLKACFALVASFACVLSGEKDLFWHHRGVGSVSATTFVFIDTFVMISVVMTWYWLLTVIGRCVLVTDRTPLTKSD